MTENAQDFRALMQRLRAGEEDAARELLARYGEHILRVVRRKLHKQLRSKFDSIDFVQAVWASFFADAPEKYTFDHPRALMAFLATLAQNKVVEAVRQRMQRMKYNVNRERRLEVVEAGIGKTLIGRDPSPSQVAVAQDEWARMIDELPTRYQRLLVLLRDGHTQKENAAELGVNEKTVRRLLEKLRPPRP
jgi:RNA polymerase sigma-70 factor (ECF subfamily)